MCVCVSALTSSDWKTENGEGKTDGDGYGGIVPSNESGRSLYQESGMYRLQSSQKEYRIYYKCELCGLLMVMAREEVGVGVAGNQPLYED